MASPATDGARASRLLKNARVGISQRIRMRIESIFGWLENGRMRRTRYRGRRKTQFAAYLVGAAYDLLRLARLRECVA